MKFRKKPVVIEAHQWGSASEAPQWFKAAIVDGTLLPDEGNTLTVRTLEDGNDWRAKHVASPGDWIIQGVHGELYPCKPDIFEKTYEAAE